MARQIRPGQLQENVLYNISASYAVTASYAMNGGGGGVPSGTVSGSAQITELGFVTSSATSSFVTNSQTASMSVATASYVTSAQSASYILAANIDQPFTTVSASGILNTGGGNFNIAGNGDDVVISTGTSAFVVESEAQFKDSVNIDLATNRQLIVSGGRVDLRNALGVSGSFSGSFEGDGSGLTGITAEWDGSHLGNASITGSLILSASSGTTSNTLQIGKNGYEHFIFGKNADDSTFMNIYARPFTDPDLFQIAYSSNTSTTAELALGASTVEIGDMEGSSGNDTKLLINADAGYGDVGFQFTNHPITVLGSITSSGNISSSAASTASFGTYLGDGSQLSGISSTPFPFTGDAVITGSLILSGSLPLLSLPDAPKAAIVISGSNDGTRLRIYDTEDNLSPVYTEGAGIVLTGGEGAAQSILEMSAVGSANGGSNNEQTFIRSSETLNITAAAASTGQNIKIRGTAWGWNLNSSNSGTDLIFITNGGATRSTLELGTTTGVAGTGVALSSRTAAVDFTIVAGGNTWLDMSSTKATFIADVSSSAASTASFGTYLGDGSQLSGISSTPFPFTGSAIITGSLTVLGEFNAFRVNSTNLSLGSGAGFNNTINGPRNVFLGQNAGYTNTTGDDNVCIGYAAGYALSTNASDFNVFIGRLAGAGGTSPVARMSDANYNIGIGQEALLYLTSGDSNIGFGFRTMRNISSGTYNIAFGDAALSSTSTGQNNIGIGRSAGNLQTTGTGNITIGSGSQGIAGESNQLRIGHGNTLTTISASLETGDIIFASTASAAYFVGDGSQLTNVASPFTAAGISGSFTAPSASFSTRVTTLEGAGTPTPTFIASGSTSASAAPDTGVVVEHSGSTAFSVIGDVGTLFSVDDDLTGTLFSANDISGFPVLQADATGEVYLGKSPQSLYTTAVISSTTAATTHSLCTLSTSSYDGGFFEYTAHSASNARAGNIMSTWNGSNIVYAETTTMDIGDTSDLTTEVIISGSTARLIAYGANASYKIKTIIKAI